jgi:hypothetical protein
MSTAINLPVGAAVVIGDPEGDEPPRLAFITGIRFYLDAPGVAPGITFSPDQVFTIEAWFLRRKVFLAAESAALVNLEKELIAKAAERANQP